MIHQMTDTSVSSQHLRHTSSSDEINKAVTEVQHCTVYDADTASTIRTSCQEKLILVLYILNIKKLC